MSASPLKVLVVDDEPPIRKLLRMGLGTQGYQTIDAPNARAALDLMSSTPDLVILDLGLPDMQGHELLSMIRSRNPSIPIIVLSSRGDEAGKVQALDFAGRTAAVQGWRPVGRSGAARRQGRRQGRETFAQGI